MRSGIEELERQRTHLSDLAAIQSKHGLDGTLRTELAEVRQKIGAVTVDTPHQEVNDALQREATLALRLTRGEAELQRVETEISYLKQLENQARERAESERREEQRKRNVALDQIRGIDDLLSGRKLIKADPSLRGTDIQDDIRRKRSDLEQLRQRVMKEAGLTEADLPQAPVASPTQLRPDGRGWT